MNLRASAIVMKSLPATVWGDALLISREEARRIGYELEQAAERIEALEARATPVEGMAIVPVDAIKLLEIAKCPQCDNGGAYYDNHGGVCQCQWCYEKDMALAAAKEKGE